MGCCRFCYILIPSFFSLVALVLSAIACAGSSKNNSFLTDIYYIDLNLSGLDASSLAKLAGGSSDITSAISSLTSSDSINRDLGLSDVYTFGMWGYCKGDLKNGESLASYTTDAVDFTYCSKAKAMYVFDPAGVILADLTNQTTSDSDSDISTVVSTLKDNGISFASSIEDYMNVAKAVSKLIFICTIIGIVLTFVQVLLSLITVCSKGVSCLVFIMSALSFISLLLACAASTGAFIYIKKQFNNAASDYGITANLSEDYLVFYWIAVAASLVASIFWMFSICCCSTGPFFGPVRRRNNVYVEAPPMVEKL